MTADRLTVVMWKWRGKGNWKRYTAGHVNALVAMVDAHCDVSCDFVLVTDDTQGVDPAVRCLPLDRVAAKLPKDRMPHRNAYRRVGLFDARMREVLGGRIMQFDLDTVITNDFTDLAKRAEPFVIWKSPSVGERGYALNPSFILLDAGSMPHIHDGYTADPDAVALQARIAGWTGTDQAIIAHLASDGVTTVDDVDGIISFRDHLKGGEHSPDENVKIVSFMDRFDPADPALQERCPWIAQHYPYRSMKAAV